MVYKKSIYLRYSASFVYGLTAIIGCYGMAVHPGEIRSDDAWFAFLLCLISASSVIFAIWVLIDEALVAPFGLPLVTTAEGARSPGRPEDGIDGFESPGGA